MTKPYFARWGKADLRDLIAHQMMFARQSMSLPYSDADTIATSNSFCIQILLSQNTDSEELVPFRVAREVILDDSLTLESALSYADGWITKYGGCIKDKMVGGCRVAEFNDFECHVLDRVRTLVTHKHPKSGYPKMLVRKKKPSKGPVTYTMYEWDTDHTVPTSGTITDLGCVGESVAINLAIEASINLYRMRQANND